MRLRVEVTRNLILGWSESNAWYSVKLFLANCLESFSGVRGYKWEILTQTNFSTSFTSHSYYQPKAGRLSSNYWVQPLTYELPAAAVALESELELPFHFLPQIIEKDYINGQC